MLSAFSGEEPQIDPALQRVQPFNASGITKQVRHLIRLKHYSIRTEKSYLAWVDRYLVFHKSRDPKEMGSEEIEAFLSHLALDLKVSASTQNQAFNALLFLYKEVLRRHWAAQ